MANPSMAHEPSMEEILASIRQIISEDGEGAKPEPVAPEPARSEAQRSKVHATASLPQSDPKTETPASPIGGREGVASSIRPSSPPEKTSVSEPQPERAPRPAPDPAPAAFKPSYVPSRPAEAAPRGESRNAVARGADPAPRPAPPTGGAPLLSAGSDAAVSGSFSALAHTILAQNARTLEDLVSEMLRPMLQGWLDENLPGLVERLVKEEIDRVSRGRR